MVARTLAAAPILADAIVRRLGGSRAAPSLPNPFSSDGVPSLNSEVSSDVAPPLLGDELSERLWADLWPIERKRQREFFCFGMDVLLKVKYQGLTTFVLCILGQAKSEYLSKCFAA